MLRHRLEQAAVETLGSLARALGREEAAALGKMLGRAACTLLASRRRLAEENLAAVYGDAMNEKERRTLARRVFEHYGRVSMDLLRFPLVHARNWNEVMEMEGWENLEAAQRRGRGVLLVTAHLGNWELAGLCQGYAGLPMTLLTRPLDNPYLERRLAQYRSRSGNRVLHKRDSAPAIMRALKGGQIVAVVMDQHFHGESAVWAPFMGRMAATAPVAALLSLRMEAPIVMAFPVAQADGRWKVIYEKGPEISATGQRDRDARALTLALNTRIEHYIRLYPEQWMWMHRRWRKPPPEALMAAPEDAPAEQLPKRSVG